MRTSVLTSFTLAVGHRQNSDARSCRHEGRLRLERNLQRGHPAWRGKEARDCEGACNPPVSTMHGVAKIEMATVMQDSKLTIFFACPCMRHKEIGFLSCLPKACFAHDGQVGRMNPMKHRNEGISSVSVRVVVLWDRGVSV